MFQNNFERIQHYNERLAFATLESVCVLMVSFCSVLPHASLQISTGIVAILMSKSLFVLCELIFVFRLPVIVQE